MDAQTVPTVSLITVIANPDRYHNKVIVVGGFVRVQFEGNAVYTHKDDFTYSITKNGLWLNFGKAKAEDVRSIHQKYTLLKGRFIADDFGHMRLYSGSLLVEGFIKGWQELHSNLNKR